MYLSPAVCPRTYANVSSAIKTYNGEGVAAGDVIKWHHTIIHSSEDAPEPQQNELPRRGELPMQPQPIKVETWDRARALDGMARLDYGTQYVFDRNVPNISMFGRIAPSHLAVFYSQLNLVQNRINAPHSSKATRNSASSVAGSITTVKPNEMKSRRPMTPPYPSEKANVQSLKSSSMISLAQLPSSTSAPGVISVDEMQRILDDLRAHAKQHDFQVPDLLSQDQLERLASDQRIREVYLDRVGARWRASSLEDDYGEDDDDENNEEDDDEEGDDGDNGEHEYDKLRDYPQAVTG